MKLLKSVQALVVVVVSVSAVAATSEGSARLDVYDWATANGANTSKVVLKDDGEAGSILHAREDIEQGEVILSLPANLLFPTRVSEHSPVAHMIENTTIGRITAICLYLISERADRSSHWETWLRSLPPHFYHALSYSEEDMAHFQASSFKELRDRKKKNVRKEYEQTVAPLLHKLPAFDPLLAAVDQENNVTREAFSYEAFEWAYSVVTTRGIFPGLLGEEEREGDVPLLVLGPLADSFIHGAAAVKIAYDANEHRCIFTALHKIAKNSAISIGVGMSSNMELLANRGFMMQNNVNNFVLMKFQLDKDSDMHASARESMMKQLNLSNPMTYVVRYGEMPQGLLASLRIQSLSPVEFASFAKALASPVTLENEWRAYRLLISSCNTILNLYPT
eukprot:752321-Hanusia_phi.AAC.2